MSTISYIHIAVTEIFLGPSYSNIVVGNNFFLSLIYLNTVIVEES